jgi:serine/threonine protein kinase
MALAFAPESEDLAGYLPTNTLGSFQLLDRLATGGMASIYKAEDTRTGELVALKTVRHGGAREVACLEREIALLKSLRHPGVVQFRGAGTWNDSPWLAMELLEGHTLFEEMSLLAERSARSVSVLSSDGADAGDGWMHRLQELPELAWPVRPAASGRLRDAVSMIVRLARVLAYLHGQGVVHRDLKPENIFVGGDGRMTLLDFGLASRIRGARADARDGRPTSVATTVEYAAPELLCGERVDERVDVYALGCVFYELVTGARPFEADSVDEIVRLQLDEAPTCPSDLVTGVSWRLEDLILDMLAKRPKHRPRNGAEVAARLSQAFYADVADGSRRAAA